MTVFESNNKAVEFDIEALRSPEGREGFLCISQSTWAMAYSLVMGYGYWRSRYYKEGASTLETLTDEEWEEVTDIVDLAVEELSMSGCDDLINAIGDVSTQIAGIGLQMGDLSVSLVAQQQTACCSPYGSVPPVPVGDQGDPDTDPVPDGFASWDDYFVYKCEAANKIVDDWIDTVGNLATLGGVLGAIGAVALGLFLQTSLLSGMLVGLMAVGFSAGAAAAVVVGALVALVAGGLGLFAYFADLAGDMATAKADVICDLYDAESVGDATAILLAFTSDEALGLTYDPADDDVLFQATVNAMAGALLSTSVMNSLFELDTDVQGYSGSIDCGVDCSLGIPWVWASISGVQSGSGSLVKDGTERTLTAETGYDQYYRINFELDTETTWPGEDWLGVHTINAEFQITSWVPNSPVLTTSRSYYWVGNQRTLNNWGQNVRTDLILRSEVQMTSASPFSIDITLNNNDEDT